MYKIVPSSCTTTVPTTGPLPSTIATVTAEASTTTPSSRSLVSTSISVLTPATTVTSSSSANGAVLAGSIVIDTSASPDSPCASVTEYLNESLVSIASAGTVYKIVPSSCTTAIPTAGPLPSTIEIVTISASISILSSRSFARTFINTSAPASTVAESSSVTGAELAGVTVTTTVASADAPPASVTE